jgi:hypothetical protein
MRVAPKIILTSQERAELKKLACSKLTRVRLAQRARIVLLAAQTMLSKDIAQELRVGRVQVSRGRECYAESRPVRASSVICRVAHRLPRSMWRVWWS